MNRQLENKNIAEAIRLLEHGQYRERKQYLQSLKDIGVCEINGYTFMSETYCWVVWKPTDIGEDPQYKGESLYKVVPRTDLTIEQISNILDNQSWIYP